MRIIIFLGMENVVLFIIVTTEMLAFVRNNNHFLGE